MRFLFVQEHENQKQHAISNFHCSKQNQKFYIYFYFLAFAIKNINENLVVFLEIVMIIWIPEKFSHQFLILNNMKSRESKLWLDFCLFIFDVETVNEIQADFEF